MQLKKSVLYNNYDLLYEEYVVKNKRVITIARYYSVGCESLRRHIEALGIRKREK